MLIPMLAGEMPFFGWAMVLKRAYAEFRIRLSPVKGPPAVVVLPEESVLELTALLVAIECSSVSTAVTSDDAALVIVVVSCVMVSETGAVDFFETVTLTPGRRFVKVFPVEVTVCAAGVPAHRVTAASDAVWMAAAPGWARRSGAVPALMSLEDPPKKLNAPEAPVWEDVSCSRYSAAPVVAS